MLWVIFAFLAALFDSTKDLLSKSCLKHVNEYVISFALRFFAFLFLLPLLFIVGIPELGKYFWLAWGYATLSVVITTILILKALKHSDLSKVSPIITFSPLFILFISPILLGEFTSTIGIIGVLLIIIGSYFLNIREFSAGYFAPFRALFKEKGLQLMLIVAIMWAIGSNVDKVGVLNSSPIFWSVMVNFASALILFPIMLKKASNGLRQIKGKFWILLPIGLSLALMHFFQMKALSIQQVVYVISIKRTSVLISVLFGYLFLKEQGIKERLFAAATMVVGVILILNS